MNPQKITQQWFAFQKQSFENFQSIWQQTQKQTSSAVDRLLDQSVWIPQENRQIIENWRSLMKKEGERFAAFVDRGLQSMKNCWNLQRRLRPLNRIKPMPTKGGTDGNQKCIETSN